MALKRIKALAILVQAWELACWSLRRAAARLASYPLYGYKRINRCANGAAARAAGLRAKGELGWRDG